MRILPEKFFFVEALTLTQAEPLVFTFCTDQLREIFTSSERKGRVREIGIEGGPDPVGTAEEMIEFGDTIVAHNRHLNVGSTQEVFRQKINDIQGVTEFQKKKLYSVSEKPRYVYR